MAESLPKDKGEEGKKDSIEDNMADWERRLAEGDLPEDFLEVTEPGADKNSKRTTAVPTPTAATGLLVDIPTVTASNSVPTSSSSPPPTHRGMISQVPVPGITRNLNLNFQMQMTVP